MGMIASTAFTIGTKALQAVASFATVHKLVQFWGLPGYGLWVMLTAFAVYIALFDLGVGSGTKNRISEAWGRGNTNEAAVTVRACVAIYFVASMLALVCGVFVVLFVAPFKDHVLAAGIVWAACVVSFFLSFHNMVLQGLGRFKALALLSLLAPCLWYALLQLWPRGTPLPLDLAATLYGATLVLQAVVTMKVSTRIHDFRIGAWWRTTREEYKPVLRTGSQFVALQLSAFALYGSGNFIVYRVLGAVETAQYDAANKVFMIITIAFSTLISVAWVEISRAKAVGDAARLSHIHRLLHVIAILFIGIAIGACSISGSLTHALTGISVPASSTAAFVVLIGVQLVTYTSAVFLSAFERLRAQIIAAIVSIPTFFAAAFFLFSKGWGMPSIPIASAVALLPTLGVCYLVARRLVATQQSDGASLAVNPNVSR
jgi:O-antigen/teichoic acid export membrane protein